MEPLTSRERLLRTLHGKPVDRIAISLLEFDGFYESWIHDDQDYQGILDYAEGKTDRMFFWQPEQDRPVLFLGQVDERDVKIETVCRDSSTCTRVAIETPLGELVSEKRQDAGIHTEWTTEHFCKSAEDAERILSIPYTPWKPSVDSFFDLDQDLGGMGIILGDIPDALCLTVDIFGFSAFIVAYVDNPKLITRLLDFFQERIYNYVGHLLESGAITLYRIYGPEYATPPYLPPEEFGSLVARYDREIIDLLHKHGAMVRMHCHGNIRLVLNDIARMGIDALDPIEPVPDGDISLREVRAVLGEGVTLIGNIEERLLETGSRKEIETAVKTAIEEGAQGGPFILCPTAMPLNTPLDGQIRDNILHFIDCGLRYGTRGAT